MAQRRFSDRLTSWELIPFAIPELTQRDCNRVVQSWANKHQFVLAIHTSPPNPRKAASFCPEEETGDLSILSVYILFCMLLLSYCYDNLLPSLYAA